MDWGARGCRHGCLDGRCARRGRRPWRRCNAAEASPGTTILIAPGTYTLTSQIDIYTDGLTIRGDSSTCDDVVLTGTGMNVANNARHGISAFGAKDLTIANLTIRDVYNHPIQLQPESDGARIYNVKLLDAGQQFIKANPSSQGLDGAADARVEYSVIEYTNGTPAHPGDEGYTNCMSLHDISGWVIANNLFKNVHNPDSVQRNYWHVPCILAWNGASDTTIENNTFINCDRAIALGLCSNNGCPGHTGGVIRNNFIFMEPNLFSATRRNAGDGVIIGWKAPGAQVVHNTVIGNGNHYRSIEFRQNASGVAVRNNLVDLPVGTVGTSITSTNNVQFGVSDFTDLFDLDAAANGDLHLLSERVSRSTRFRSSRWPGLTSTGTHAPRASRRTRGLMRSYPEADGGGGGGPQAPAAPSDAYRLDARSEGR